MLWVRLMVVALLFVLLDWGGWITWLRRGLEVIVWPTRAVFSFVSVQADLLSRQVRFARVGALRMVDLERQVAEYAPTVSRVSELERENAALKVQVGVLDSTRRYVQAEVVSATDGSYTVAFRGSPVFEAGSTVVYQDHLVGVVERVGASVAMVSGVDALDNTEATLVSASGSYVGRGVVRGGPSYGVLLDNVSQDIFLVAGTVVTTTGSERVLPGLVVGRVAEIVSSDSSVYQQAVVVPVYRPGLGEFVYIVEGEAT